MPELEDELKLKNWLSIVTFDVFKYAKAGGAVEVEWSADGTIPEDIRLVAVATSTEAAQPNYPPQDWLEGEDWPGDVMADSEDDTAAAAYGV